MQGSYTMLNAKLEQCSGQAMKKTDNPYTPNRTAAAGGLRQLVWNETADGLQCNDFGPANSS